MTAEIVSLFPMLGRRVRHRPTGRVGIVTAYRAHERLAIQAVGEGLTAIVNTVDCVPVEPAEGTAP
ncbi:hypothetical protein CCR85_01105 [Rhodothalassium salexigens]|uniref:hypothetical protein n=1 Tax=Rhodothalassium salexigens TaxID=1086 RepID=UPI0019136E7D|nr:hypothetical protein [Rhodothalassium salexigens]MBK5910091.1 hypothetical protein [Rhodothalassium salexigens]MBK5920704.1 hypothetical protein [Rhodothalassium salexigens]